MAADSNLPYTDPWTVLGVHRGANKEEVKAAFRRAALVCHPDVDPSPQAAARFTAVKTAADVLLKGHQPSAAAAAGAPRGAAWSPAAGRGARVAPNRVAALWGGLFIACGLAFGYGYGWQSYVRSKARYGLPEEVEARMRSPTPQRRQLLAVLLQDKRQQAQQGQDPRQQAPQQAGGARQQQQQRQDAAGHGAG